MNILFNFIYFFLIWLIELVNPDRKSCNSIALKKITILDIRNSRLLANYSFGIMWIFFINFFGRSIYELYNQFYNYSYYSLNFQRNNLFTFIVFLLIIDYSTYLWHRANHKFKILRRFHQVHHSDLAVDSTTTFRFHFGELFLHLVLKLILMYLLRINLIWFFISETLLLFFGVFHHSNIYLPKKVDWALSLFIVTPRYHYNHHQLDLAYANSNYSSILTIWDRLHGTYTMAIRTSNNPLGILKARESDQLNFLQLLKIPFKL